MGKCLPGPRSSHRQLLVHGQLEGLSRVAQLVAHAGTREGRAECRAGARQQRLALRHQALGRERSSRSGALCGPGRGGARRRPGQGPRHTGCAWAQQPRDARAARRGRPRAAGPAPPNGSTSPRGSIPRSIVTRRSAASISPASATRTTPSASSSGPRSSSAARPAIARSAAPRLSRTSPARESPPAGARAAGSRRSRSAARRRARNTRGPAPHRPSPDPTRTRTAGALLQSDRPAARAHRLDVQRRQRQRPAPDQAF